MRHIESRLWAFLILAIGMVLPSSAWADGGHQLRVTAKPQMAGSFNTSAAELEAGQSIQLVAYANANFTFLRWTDDKGTEVSRQMDFNYVMPDGDVTLTAEYEYNPANPANPARNYWNKALGDVIVDDFTTGSLQNAVKNVIGDSKAADVMMITVAGVINSNDFGIVNSYSNCTLLDLSRVAGVTQVPSYAFDYTKLESAYLPATIEKIGYRAFYECQQLSSLIVYAMTPPELESQVFTGVPDGLVVYVPAAAIAQYQDADVWKDFTILPIQEDIRSISISLPQGADATDYAQMWLELTNTKSGQRMHYVMTDRQTYTFANIIRNTSWNVTLRNERGDVFGRIDNVEVKDEDVTITFASLTKPQSVTLSVKTPDGKNVTEQTQITWTDTQGNYVAQGASLTGLPVGYQVNYRLALSQELAMAYNTPTEVAYTLKDGGNDITLQLSPITQITLSGKVKDATTGLPLSDAVVSASQTFGGKYSKTLNAKTDNKGEYTLTVADVPTSLGIAATDYISQTITLNNGLSGVNGLDDVSLKPITGATITVNLTYTTVEGETQSWYSDYQNVGYTLYNVTKNRAVTQFNVQYPQIVLLEDVDDGDVLRLTATSRTNAFMPVESTATIAEQRAETTLNLVELGQLQVELSQSGNANVAASLYDAGGKLVKTDEYREMLLTISNLADGNYTLISMGSSRFFNNVYNLSQLPQTGLIKGTDYVQNDITIKSGEVTALNISMVPKFDESKLYYTGESTSFTVNKTSIVVGNYLTLTGHIDFKPAYANNVSNVQMIVDLPESCEFVENSVMVGNSTSSYTLNGNQITIPMTRYTDRIRFCIIPMLGGDYAPSAFARFDIDGETVTQPIGNANYTAKDLSITVPSTIAKTSVLISGTANGTSSVEIYDNGILIGQTKSLANGTWEVNCELNEPYNLSTHNIHAIVTTKAGMELTSETKQVVYDKNAVVPEKVTMLYYNPEYVGQYNIVFDLINRTVTPDQYYFFPYKRYPNWRGSGTEPKEFTFVADLSNNDSTAVNGVTICVYTDNGYWRNLEAQYDTSMNRWVAVSQFVEEEAPVGVEVEIDAIMSPALDSKELVALQNAVIVQQEHIAEEKEKSSQILTSILEELHSDAPDFDKIEKLFDNYDLPLSEGIEVDSLENLDDDLLLEYAQNIRQQTTNFINTEEVYLNTIIEEYQSKTNFEFEYIGQTYKIDITEPYTSDASTLLADGFSLIQSTSDYMVYEKYINSEYIRIDLMKNICVTMSISNSSVSMSRTDIISKSELASIDAYIMDSITKLQSTKGAFNNFILWFSFEKDKIFKTFVRHDEEIANAIRAIEKKMSSSSGFKYLTLAEERVALMAERASLTASWNVIAKSMETTIKCVGTAINGITNIIVTLKTEYDNCVKVASISIPYCLYSYPTTVASFENEIKDLFNYVRDWAVWTINRVIIYAIVDAVVAAALPEAVILPCALGFLELGGEMLYARLKQIEFDNLYNNLKYRINNVKKMLCKDDNKCPRCGKNPCECKDKCPRCGNRPCTCPPKCPRCGKNPCVCPPPNNNTKVKHDPSGYVYEGVTSNRLQGVMASCYYKETAEDMYGDLHENVVLWDAEEYAQKNPLFTDEYGMYRWDVPKGLWQVKFEKEGYQTTYSEWLPVPPPQLEVNIAMKQNVQPNVKLARAYEDAVEVEFDKYMIPELLTTDNIIVMQGNEAVAGSVELLNNEASYEGSSETFASKIRFNAAQPFTEQEVTLIVNNRVKSYAGIRMQDDYQQTFTIEQEIKQIVSDSLTVVDYGGESILTVSVLPASASKGKTLNVKTSSPMILGVETEHVMIGNDGKAEVTISGELPGTAALTFSVEGTDKTAITIASVEQKVKEIVTAPTANIASGTVVERGTAIVLSCETQGATIYYTIDGSCPCNEDTRQIYDGTPIIISKNTIIQAMAVVSGMDDSDVVTFVYKVTPLFVVLDENSATLPTAIADVNVHVKRTISANVWSTICLPFAMSKSQVWAAFGNDVLLKDFDGCTTERDNNGDVVGIQINFKDAQGIEANHPYLIRVSSDITDFSADGVDIKAEEKPHVDKDSVTANNKWICNSFVGNYVSEVTVPENCLFVNGGKLYYSKGLSRLRGYRGYFDFYDVLKDMGEAAARITFSFDGLPSGLTAPMVDQKDDAPVYDLNGRRVNRAVRGVYITNNKKIRVK